MLAIACGGDGSSPKASPTLSPSPAVVPPSPTLEPTPTPIATPSAATPGPPATSRIAFLSQHDGNLAIYVMNADGSGQTRLTTGGGAGPTWSPDGSRIAFESARDGNLEIHVINADGSGQTRLTDNRARDEFPVWSPAP